MGFDINSTFLVIIIVLLALIILTLIISRYGKVLNAKNEGNNTRIDGNLIDAATEINAGASEEELIAVLTAAIAASFNDSFANGFRVKSFKRVPQSDSLWNVVARNEQVLGKL